MSERAMSTPAVFARSPPKSVGALVVAQPTKRTDHAQRTGINVINLDRFIDKIEIYGGLVFALRTALTAETRWALKHKSICPNLRVVSIKIQALCAEGPDSGE
jgi:hypothetical protein